MTSQTTEQIKATEDRMKKDGIAVEEIVKSDYFGFDESDRVMLPDDASWVEFVVMNEGKRRKYLNEQNRGIHINRATQDARIDTAPGDERWSLLRNTLSGWNLERGGNAVPFVRSNLDQFLENANPRIIDIIERAVRLAHPWLGSEMTTEDIDQEIENLNKLREQAIERESGK
jgi:hypothetical protein